VKFGLVKTSLIDYPGLIAAALFTRGCNLRCPYCHNPELAEEGTAPAGMLEAGEVLRFLHARRKVLEGVCISGGEPLLHPELPDFIREVRGLGYKVKIDTNGILPDVLKTLTMDYIAMDIKTLPEKYAALVGLRAGREDPEAGESAEGAKIAAAVRESAAYIIDSGIDHELRTTVSPGIFLEEDIPEIALLVRGARRYILTGMKPSVTLDPAYGKSRAPYPREALQRMRQAFLDRGVNCLVRGESRFSYPK
jgi:pyruvate formate lyase activating enzyme